MCGILACMHHRTSSNAAEEVVEAEFRTMVLKQSKLLRHRGPDWSGYKIQITPKGKNLICHERLSIIDPMSGAQPLYNEKGNLCCSVNGEIYNYQEIKSEHLQNVKFATGSDCEVIVHLYEKYGIEKATNLLDGMWSFLIADETTGDFVAARDPIGITPLYYGRDMKNQFWISSELKGLHEPCYDMAEFPPGHYYESKTGKFCRYYNPVWWNEDTYLPEPQTSPNAFEDNLKLLREGLEKAVAKRMMSDVPLGVLLSGGLDSSLTASIANRYVKAHPEMGISRLHSFSIGLEGSPDLAAAKKVADFLGTIHCGFTFTLQEGIDALEEVIYHLETYDITSIRASTPMYLMSRKIRALGVKVVLSGEGADEVYGGYLYFHKAPNRAEFHKETVRKLQQLHSYDCNRANKATSAWGIEARVPFLDKEFLDFSMTIDPSQKMITGTPDADGCKRFEKYLIRKAFDDRKNPYLPAEVLWRQKEQFSDGVGYGWIDRLKDYAETMVDDHLFANASKRFPINTPTTKEGFLYRSIFEEKFPKTSAAEIIPGGPTVACSTATAVAWCEAWKNLADASGRAVTDVHNDGYKAPSTLITI